MDFDDRFDPEEFKKHLRSLDLSDYTEQTSFEELLARTTKNTRRAAEFSFKPVELRVGDTQGFIGKGGTFYPRFQAEVDPQILNPLVVKTGATSLKSSVWIRYSDNERQFLFRCPCKDKSSVGTRPFVGIIPFQDVMPYGVQLKSQKTRINTSGIEEDRVLAYLTIQCKRPALCDVLLEEVLTGSYPTFERPITEADFFPYGESGEAEAGPISPLGDSRCLIKLGLWLTYQFKFCITVRQYKLLWMCMVRLRLVELKPDFENPNEFHPNGVVPTLDWPPEWNDFSTLYLLEGLLSQSIITELEVRALHFAVSKHPVDSKLDILTGLFTRRNRHMSIQQDVDYIANRLAKQTPLEHYIYVRRCHVSPTRCILQPPQQEISNSMLRHFALEGKSDRFLRVQFVGDRGDFPASFESVLIDQKSGGKSGVFSRIRRALQHGLDIGGRHYIFLCFGESQVKLSGPKLFTQATPHICGRERGCWMLSEDDDLTVERVLRWMGDLSEERVIAKHAARQGLALSTTRALRGMNISVVQIEDIVSGGNYTFTDGSGHCSQHIASTAARSIGNDALQPSAIQIRRGGSKGVLCVVKDIQDNEIRLRPSMNKFPSENLILNVLKIATYSRGTLNRQAIVLMEAQGVSSATLFELFQEERLRIEQVECGPNPSFRMMTTFPLEKALGAGFTKDPMVLNIVQLLKCRMLRDLKWKAWIDVADSAFLMGVADESGELESGKIFCQIQPSWESSSQVVTGDCTIFRNPCLHPGDVRRVTAVQCPALQHLKNVIVFSTRGDRDLPNMLSGGDLYEIYLPVTENDLIDLRDGDYYTVIWDSRLLVTKEHPPMDYTPSLPKRVDRPIVVDDVKDFFLEYIMNDNLGRVCNTHLAQADANGPDHFECLKLASLASLAVDFTKTGVKVEPDSFSPPSSYPDFMGKKAEKVGVFRSKERKTYESHKVLGRMFREIDPEPEFKTVSDEGFGDPTLMSLPLPDGYAHYLTQAAQQKLCYDFAVAGLMRTYNINEYECVAGVILHSREHRLQVEKDYSLKVAVHDAYAQLGSGFRAQTADYLRVHPVASDDKDWLNWALACYQVTHNSSLVKLNLVVPELDHASGMRDNEGGKKLFVEGIDEQRYSFPWLYSAELCELVKIEA